MSTHSLANAPDLHLVANLAFELEYMIAQPLGHRLHVGHRLWVLEGGQLGPLAPGHNHKGLIRLGKELLLQIMDPHRLGIAPEAVRDEHDALMVEQMVVLHHLYHLLAVHTVVDGDEIPGRTVDNHFGLYLGQRLWWECIDDWMTIGWQLLGRRGRLVPIDGRWCGEILLPVGHDDSAVGFNR